VARLLCIESREIPDPEEEEEEEIPLEKMELGFSFAVSTKERCEGNVY